MQSPKYKLSAVSGQLSAVSNQLLAISGQLSAVSGQQSAFSYQRSAVSKCKNPALRVFNYPFSIQSSDDPAQTVKPAYPGSKLTAESSFS
ncbi:hypothetical protein KIH39_22225 [Telmatocola sphagniphila]|uniref:Uncharacterized protein n=1 Tax=Telmatocola sphagniphila TaxID=1123043 RepID=A0A8E6B6N6_9BACT|nr:hypothetical protein [Telmatocola sphagniphila]QVL31533.1 hypothetical protein KIH39_22225 [Telmatocola sphagniphila]